MYPRAERRDLPSGLIYYSICKAGPQGSSQSLGDSILYSSALGPFDPTILLDHATELACKPSSHLCFENQHSGTLQHVKKYDFRCFRHPFQVTLFNLVTYSHNIQSQVFINYYIVLINEKNGILVQYPSCIYMYCISRSMVGWLLSNSYLIISTIELHISSNFGPSITKETV